MHGAYAYTQAIWLPLAAGYFVALLGLYAWRRRDVPAGIPFLAASAVGSLLLVSIAFETAGIAAATRTAWHQRQYGLQMLAAAAGTWIALDYTCPGRRRAWRAAALLALPPVVTVLLIVADAGLIWQELWVGPTGKVVADYTALGMLSAAYAGGVLLIVNAAAFLRLFARSPQHRWPVALMLCGQVAVRVLILLAVTSTPASMGIDLSVIAVLAPWTMNAIALLGFHILDPLPPARQTALAQMREGMIVLDASQRVASVNPAAAAMLETSAARARGKLLPELLPALAELPADVTAAAVGQDGEPAEISFAGSTGEHCYAAEYTALSDFRGQLVGCLLMLRDITEQKRARVQLLEQERALATLRERERLARELHDGIAQLLAAAHLQANTAKLLSARSQGAQLQACLDNLAATTLQAEADLRAYLLEVKTTTAGAQPLFPTLREYLAHFTRSCGIPVKLMAPSELEERGLPPAVEVQLLRIIQEALTNVRKHAGITPATAVSSAATVSEDAHEPCHVQIIFTQAGAHAQVTIVDDGCGFDPAAEPGRGSGYGLRSMAERAQAAGGCLAVSSRPGQGTQVTVLVPQAAGRESASTAANGSGAQGTAVPQRNGVAG